MVGVRFASCEEEADCRSEGGGSARARWKCAFSHSRERWRQERHTEGEKDEGRQRRTISLSAWMTEKTMMKASRKAPMRGTTTLFLIDRARANMVKIVEFEVG